MKASLLMLLAICPLLAYPQRGRVGLIRPGDSTVELAWLLTLNRNTQTVYWGVGPKKMLARLDTTAAVTGETLSRKAMAYLTQGDYEKGVALLEKSTQIDSKQYRNAGRVYLYTLRDYDRALHYLNAFDALTPGFDDTDGIYPVSYHKGLAQRNLGHHAEAIREFSIGIDSLAKKHGTEWVNYKQYVSRAIAYLALQQPDKALADLEQAAKNATSESPLVLFYQARAYRQMGRPTDARRALQDAQFFWQANRVKGITQPEDSNNPVTEEDIEAELSN